MMSDDTASRSPGKALERLDSAVIGQRASNQLSDEALQSFAAQYGTEMQIAPDRALPAYGGQGFRLGLVKSGILLATIELPNDRRQVLCLYCPGNLIFADAFARNEGAKFKAVGEVTILGLNDQSFCNAQAQAPGALAMLLSEATRHINDLMLHSAAIGRLRSEERLATFFLELALRIAQPARDAASFEFRMRRDDIADYLSMNRDTLSRSMSQFRRDGVISFVNPNFVIVQWKALSDRTPLAAAMLEWHRNT